MPMNEPALPDFKPRFPWWGADLQTVRNRLVHRARALPATTEERVFALDDGTGDRMMARLDTPEGGGSGPVVVLIHGLMGCDHSAYIHESARFHLERGRRVLRVNLRGAGPSRAYATRFYFAGCWPDILAVLEGMAPEAPDGFFIVGFSLGGSVTLNTLPHMPDALNIRGAATVSVPIDPMQAAIRLMQRRNFIYEKVFVYEMKLAYGRLDILTPAMRENLAAARTILGVDDAATAPLHGYADAASYYAATAGQKMIPRIRHPLLLIHAADDPWIPADPYLALQRDMPKNVTLTLTRKGGHVGFHGTHGPQAWHDLRIDAYMRGLGLYGA